MRLEHITATPHPLGNRIDLTWNTDDFGSGPELTMTTRGTF